MRSGTLVSKVLDVALKSPRYQDDDSVFGLNEKLRRLERVSCVTLKPRKCLMGSIS